MGYVTEALRAGTSLFAVQFLGHFEQRPFPVLRRLRTGWMIERQDHAHARTKRVGRSLSRQMTIDFHSLTHTLQ